MNETVLTVDDKNRLVVDSKKTSLKVESLEFDKRPFGPSFVKICFLVDDITIVDGKVTFTLRRMARDEHDQDRC